MTVPRDLSEGPELYSLVEEFAALGNHRTGEPTDRLTAEWLAEVLVSLGLEVEVQPVPFDRWVGTSHLSVGGQELESLPLYYEWTGSLETTNVAVTAFDPQSGGLPEAVNGPIEVGIAGGYKASILVTEHPHGSLVGVNRELEAPRSGHPVVLAAGRDLAALRSGTPTLALSGRIEPGETFNVVARSSTPGTPLLITTPVTGWFRCAGERGTGIATLLHMVKELDGLALQVVLTGGHELGFFGAHRWVDGCTERPLAVVHVGASVAVDTAADGDVDSSTSDGGHTVRQLIDMRLAMCSLGADRCTEINKALAGAGLSAIPDTATFIGEGTAWSRLGVPLLSTTGAGIDFHTPEDVTPRVTSPGSLMKVSTAMSAAAVEIMKVAKENV